jgi:hypothetical protein
MNNFNVSAKDYRAHIREKNIVVQTADNELNNYLDVAAWYQFEYGLDDKSLFLVPVNLKRSHLEKTIDPGWCRSLLATDKINTEKVFCRYYGLIHSDVSGPDAFITYKNENEQSINIPVELKWNSCSPEAGTTGISCSLNVSQNLTDDVIENMVLIIQTTVDNRQAVTIATKISDHPRIVEEIKNLRHKMKIEGTSEKSGKFTITFFANSDNGLNISDSELVDIIHIDVDLIKCLSDNVRKMIREKLLSSNNFNYTINVPYFERFIQRSRKVYQDWRTILDPEETYFGAVVASSLSKNEDCSTTKKHNGNGRTAPLADDQLAKLYCLVNVLGATPAQASRLAGCSANTVSDYTRNPNTPHKQEKAENAYNNAKNNNPNFVSEIANQLETIH